MYFQCRNLLEGERFAEMSPIEEFGRIFIARTLSFNEILFLLEILKYRKTFK
jgi:hypothetical protein